MNNFEADKPKTDAHFLFPSLYRGAFFVQQNKLTCCLVNLIMLCLVNKVSNYICCSKSSSKVHIIVK